MGSATKYFLKKLLDHEIFRSMASWAMIFLKFLNPSGPRSYILNVRSLSSFKMKSWMKILTLMTLQEKSNKGTIQAFYKFLIISIE